MSIQPFLQATSWLFMSALSSVVHSFLKISTVNASSKPAWIYCENISWNFKGRKCTFIILGPLCLFMENINLCVKENTFSGICYKKVKVSWYWKCRFFKNKELSFHLPSLMNRNFVILHIRQEAVVLAFAHRTRNEFFSNNMARNQMMGTVWFFNILFFFKVSIFEKLTENWSYVYLLHSLVLNAVYSHLMLCKW